LQGLVGVVLADKDYPERAAYAVINKVLDDYERRFGDTWALIHADGKEPLPLLNDALRSYQDPMQADKIIKVQRQIDDVAQVAHKTINSLLDRGEKLEVLMDKSQDLSENSKIYLKNAKKLNRCCVIL
jgi:synaptobrevin family protein YKT6